MMKQKTAGEAVESSYGLNRFMNRVYGWAGVQLVAGLGLSYALSKIEWFQERPLGCILVGSAATLIGLVGAKIMKPEVQNYEKDDQLVKNTRNSVPRLMLYTIGGLGLGLLVTPLIQEANLRSPNIVPAAIAITGSLMGGASLVAYNLPKGEMFRYGHTLRAALWGLLGLELAAIIGSLIWGDTSIVRALNTADNFIGIGVFVGYMMYDTHTAIREYEVGDADHLGTSIDFLLNAWNIFIRVVEIMSGQKRRNRE